MMKKTIIAFLLTAGLALGAKAQEEKKDKITEAEVPQAVLTSFTNTFANATDVEWKKKDMDYKVSFDLYNTEQHAMFDASGTLLSQGKEITEADLPEAVSSAIKRDHPQHRVDEVYTVVKDGTTSYKIELDGSPDLKVKYSADGTKLEDKKKD
jgi:hypothetical protein